MATLVSASEIEDFIQTNLAQIAVEGYSQLKFLDNEYYLPEDEEFNDLLAKYWNEIVPSHGEVWDCDNHSREFKNFSDKYADKVLRLDHELCVGIAEGIFGWPPGENQNHRCNCVITSDWRFFFIEPQDAQPHEIGECVPPIKRLEF